MRKTILILAMVSMIFLSGSLAGTNAFAISNTIRGTPDFWSAYFDAASGVWQNIPTADRVIGTKDMGDDIKDVSEMEGGFWSNIAKKTTSAQRSPIDKARMALVEQVLAAMLNREAFVIDDSGLIQAGKDAFAGNDINQINDVTKALTSLNAQSITIPDGFILGKADPKASKASADKNFWDVLP